MHNTYTPSKLLEIIIAEKKGYKKLIRFLILVDLYENDSLPIIKLFSIRNIIIIFRRWRELFDMFYYIFTIKIQRKKSISFGIACKNYNNFIPKIPICKTSWSQRSPIHKFFMIIK